MSSLRGPAAAVGIVSLGIDIASDLHNGVPVDEAVVDNVLKMGFGAAGEVGGGIAGGALGTLGGGPADATGVPEVVGTVGGAFAGGLIGSNVVGGYAAGLYNSGRDAVVTSIYNQGYVIYSNAWANVAATMGPIH